MLQVMRRGGGACEALLTAEHDAFMRAAFGRTGRAVSRGAATGIVAEHHSADRWFACDCLGEMPYPPILVPVLGSFVRRHVAGSWPEHAAWCDFYREPAEQALVNASYSRVAATGLVRAFTGEPSSRKRPGLTHTGTEHRRGRLARVLFQLIEEAGLATAQPNSDRGIVQQYKAIRAAARGLPLEDTMPLSSCLCTYVPALDEFCNRIGSMPSVAFRKTANPHGVLIGVARSASKGFVYPVDGEPIPVAGEIAVFAERDGRDERDTLAARSPYLMACLVGRRAPRAKVEVLRAYLHPCMSERWLLPVDSNLERETFRQLMSVGRWIEFHRGARLTVRKPLWDLASPQDMVDGEAHEPIIPDFIVEAEEGGVVRRIVVETMGYGQAAYRERKARLCSEMERLGGGRVVQHDFHLPLDWPQSERDRAFWFASRQALTIGPGAVPAGGL